MLYYDLGTSTITATAVGCNGPRTATHTVTIGASVGAPVFVSGASSSRCQGAGTVTYTANATNNSGMTYSLDAASLAAGNTINISTGAVTYVAGWFGTSTITVSAEGCNGPRTASHTATTNEPLVAPVFTLGATSTRCQGAGTVTYTATATNTTGITYSLNAAAIAGGNTINSSTGAVTYAAGWTGTSINYCQCCRLRRSLNSNTYCNDHTNSKHTSIYIRCKLYTLPGSRYSNLYSFLNKYNRNHLQS